MHRNFETSTFHIRYSFIEQMYALFPLLLELEKKQRLNNMGFGKRTAILILILIFQVNSKNVNSIFFPFAHSEGIPCKVEENISQSYFVSEMKRNHISFKASLFLFLALNPFAIHRFTLHMQNVYIYIL